MDTKPTYTTLTEAVQWFFENSDFYWSKIAQEVEELHEKGEIIVTELLGENN